MAHDNNHRCFKSSHSVSRHSMVMKKAKEEDARRVADRDDGAIVVHEASGSASARLVARGETTVRSASGRMAAGVNAEVKKEGSVSGRYSTRITTRRGRATSVRVAGGDTIIRYESGDVVIKRGARRASRRNRAIWTYAFGYLILFGLFLYWLFTGTTAITPDEFVEKAFSRRGGSSIVDLERAAFEAMRGNRTPAEIRLAQTLSFYDDDRNSIHVEKGSRLTLLTAAKLGRAIIGDQEKQPAKREFREPIHIYKETYLAGVDWPHLLTIYNAIGFFLLVGLFLWRPVMHYLGTQGKKTAVALRNARDAVETAAAFREKYRALAAEVEAKTTELAARAASALEKEREEAMAQAKRQAAAISGNIQGALRSEERRLAGDIGADAIRSACDGAKEILRKRLGQAEHDMAIDELIADIVASAPGQVA